MLRSWLDSWSGVGHVLDAMTAAGHHVELRQSVFGWRAEFYREAMQHSRSTWAGVGTDVLPWRAVQIGALDVLKRNARCECWGGTPGPATNVSFGPKSCQKPQCASGWPSGSIAGMPDMQYAVSRRTRRWKAFLTRGAGDKSDVRRREDNDG